MPVSQEAAACMAYDCETRLAITFSLFSVNMEEVSNYCLLDREEEMGIKNVKTSAFTVKSKWVTPGEYNKKGEERKHLIEGTYKLVGEGNVT